jgi:hypothetical protein
MPNNPFKYDVFISAATDDEAKGKELQEALRRNGLSSYLYTENRASEDFEKKIRNALATSEYFIVLASGNACQSPWVKLEHRIFSEYEAKDPSRKIFRMKIGKGCPELLPGQILHASTIELLVPEVVRYHIEQRRCDCSELSDAVQVLERQLEKRDGEAFNHYRRSRFWRPLTNDYNVHIFTCGRDTPPDDGAGRRPSRTTIDKWDYRTVLDITHFMNRHYPATHVQIEDPVSKLSAHDLRKQSAVGRVAKLQALLRNKHCIIVGSPDVSDFAEIVLAETHKMEPYDSRRDAKQTGYVIIKDGATVSGPSSIQWTAADDEAPGVARLSADGPEYFPTRSHTKGDGEMFGILAVVSNPFSDSPINHRIVLLSGFSGVATNAIAKFLTHDDYLTEFGRFDREYANVERNIEVLIGVQFRGQTQAAHGDRREITAVSYRGLVEV